MNISEFKKLIKECILEVKVKRSVKNLIKESLKDVKVEKGESLHYKMEELSNDVKKLYKDAEVVLDDGGYYNVCSCNPHHFKIYPMTDDNFTVTYMKDNTDRIKKFNLTFSALKEFITETLKTTVGNYVQKAFYKNVENNKDKESKKEEEKKEEKKEKKKAAVTNPMMLSSDLAGTESADGEYAAMMSVGISKSSLMGDKSYSASALIWSTFDQFALSTGVTKMVIEDGKLTALNSYSFTTAYLKGTLMGLLGYTWIKPHPKYGTFGYNVGIITLMMQNAMTGGYDVSLSSSLVGFWMKPYTYSRKVTLTPQVFLMQSPLAWNTVTGGSTVNRTPGAMVGLGYDYKLSKRFGFSASYKAAMSFGDSFSLLNNIQIGSKLVF